MIYKAYAIAFAWIGISSYSMEQKQAITFDTLLYAIASSQNPVQQAIDSTIEYPGLVLQMCRTYGDDFLTTVLLASSSDEYACLNNKLKMVQVCPWQQELRTYPKINLR